MGKGNAARAVVVIGGGTGSFTLLQALKNYTTNLTAIVNMADDGGSTGTLRDELGVLPPGDVRQCLVALSQSPKVRDLFSYRFEEGSLKGHAFGNLFLAALERLTGNFAEAVETASEVLRVQGKVVPATLDNVRLRMSWAEHNVVLAGEGVIDVEQFKHDPREAKLELEPRAKANPAALEAIAAADIVVIAPGDLYTSLGPILTVDGIADALKNTSAQVVYVCNLVTKRGQTDGFDVATHAAEIERFVGAPIIETLLYNTGKPRADLLKKYAKEGEFWVAANSTILRRQHYRAIGDDFLAPAVAATTAKGDPLAQYRTFIRHDADKIARTLIEHARADGSESKFMEVETLAVFDIDRTVFDTPKFMTALCEMAAKFGVDIGAMERDQQRVESSGVSFDEAGYVFKMLGAKKSREFKDQFLRKYSRNEFLYPDAVEVFKLLDELHVPITLLTHGSKAGQLLKIATAPHLQQYPYTIIDAPNKGVRLTQVYRDSRYYIVPSAARQPAYAARRLLLFDDKQENFAGLPADGAVTAFYLEARSRTKQQAQLAITPIHIADLSESREHIRVLLA